MTETNMNILQSNVENIAIEKSGKLSNMVALQLQNQILFATEQVRINTIARMHEPNFRISMGIVGTSEINPYIIGVMYLRRMKDAVNDPENVYNLQLINGRFGSLHFTENMNDIFNRLRNQTMDGWRRARYPLSGVVFMTDNVVPNHLIIDNLQDLGAILIGKETELSEHNGSPRLVAKDYVYFAIRVSNYNIDAQTFASKLNLYTFTDVVRAKRYPYNYHDNNRITITARTFSDIQSIIGIEEDENGQSTAYGIEFNRWGYINLDLPRNKKDIKVYVCFKGRQRTLDKILFHLAASFHEYGYTFVLEFGRVYETLRDCRKKMNTFYKARRTRKTLQNPRRNSTKTPYPDSKLVLNILNDYHFILAPTEHYIQQRLREDNRDRRKIIYPSSMTIPIYKDHSIEIIGNQKYNLLQFGKEVMHMLQSYCSIDERPQSPPPPTPDVDRPFIF